MLQAIIADRETWFAQDKTVEGSPLVLVAIQKSRRRNRRGRTKYIYYLTGRNFVYYNQSRGGVMFMPIAATIKQMNEFYRAFTIDRQQPEIREWLRRNDYQLV